MRIYRSLKTSFLTQKFGKENTKSSVMPIYQSLGLIGHNGWDWAAKDGEKLYFDVSCVGEVTQKHTDSAGGLGLDIITNDKDGLMKHRYWHLKSYECEVGDTVETGDLIALADNTGRSTGTHLHRGIKPQIIDKNGNYKNKLARNGYTGGIDIQPFYKNIFVLSEIENLKKTLEILTKQVSLWQRLIQLLKSLFKLKK